MKTEQVSILITTFNRSRCLDELLTRLVELFESEILAGGAEILVFDDASKDETAAVCEKHAEFIRAFPAKSNVGYIEGRRRLIAAAQGKYLVSLDDDSCFLDEQALDVIRDTFARYPQCGIIAANIAGPSTPGGDAPVDEVETEVSNFIGCGHILRADFFQEIGGYPNFLAGYGAEETLLVLRMLEHGYKILFVPKLRIYHAEDGTQRHHDVQRAGKLVNEVGIVVYAYPLHLVILGSAYKTASHIVFNMKRKSLGAIAIAARKMPRVVRQAWRSRRPVRPQTLKRYFALRNEWTQKQEKWKPLMADVTWPEVTDMFQPQQMVPREGRGEHSSSHASSSGGTSTA